MKLQDTVRSVLKQKGVTVWSIAPEASVYEALQIMADKGIGSLLVISSDKPVGVLSERDYARKVILKDKASRQTKVSEIMTAPVIAVTPGHSVDDCMRMMTAHRVRHLTVMDGDKVAGVVSIGDLVNWIISAHEETIDQLHNYISGKYPA